MDIRGNNILVQGNTINSVMEYPAGTETTQAESDADCFHMHGNGITFAGNTCENISYAQPENPIRI